MTVGKPLFLKNVSCPETHRLNSLIDEAMEVETGPYVHRLAHLSHPDAEWKGSPLNRPQPWRPTSSESLWARAEIGRRIARLRNEMRAAQIDDRFAQDAVDAARTLIAKHPRADEDGKFLRLAQENAADSEKRVKAAWRELEFESSFMRHWIDELVIDRAAMLALYVFNAERHLNGNDEHAARKKADAAKLRFLNKMA
jgi:hypothetical protein